ncbi:unnamed protein product [Closterium sp. NIES-64]|nr:unnamed protein product [Closterium sp. NIES-64]CAI5998343.1 unnamed protein product [Closterium sp. NIES-64]
MNDTHYKNTTVILVVLLTHLQDAQVTDGASIRRHHELHSTSPPPTPRTRASQARSCAAPNSPSPPHPCIPSSFMRSTQLSLPSSSAHPKLVHAQHPTLSIPYSPAHPKLVHAQHPTLPSPTHPRIPLSFMRSTQLSLPSSSAHPKLVHAQHPTLPSPTHPRIPSSFMRSTQLSHPLLTRASQARSCAAPNSPIPYSSAHPMRLHAQLPTLPPLLIRASHASPNCPSPNHPRIQCLSMRSSHHSLPYSSAHPMPVHAQLPTLPPLLIRASHACPCAAYPTPHSSTHPPDARRAYTYIDGV